MERHIDKNCGFCNPDNQVFNESRSFYAMYNISPILPGHSLIVPKWHATTLLDLSNEEICEGMIFARDTIGILSSVFESTGFNLTIQEGKDAGQTIPHLHFHLIPRKEGDLPHPGDWYPRLKESEKGVIDSDSRPRLSDNQMREIVKKIKRYIARSRA